MLTDRVKQIPLYVPLLAASEEEKESLGSLFSVVVSHTASRSVCLSVCECACAHASVFLSFIFSLRLLGVFALFFFSFLHPFPFFPSLLFPLAPFNFFIVDNLFLFSFLSSFHSPSGPSKPTFHTLLFFPFFLFFFLLPTPPTQYPSWHPWHPWYPPIHPPVVYLAHSSHLNSLNPQQITLYFTPTVPLTPFN
ncbi:MAG: hypothetical protein JOS17DRAFT_67827 [Linnemannia elongata]|nr:MAG: hypothetical protein JOS17DRAFT_67827 [Linnemannia elongata]